MFSFLRIANGGRSHFHTQPQGDRQRIETDGTADLETRDAVLRDQLVNLPLRDIQQFRYIGHDERARFLIERIRETHCLFAWLVLHSSNPSALIALLLLVVIGEALFLVLRWCLALWMCLPRHTFAFSTAPGLARMPTCTKKREQSILSLFSINSPLRCVMDTAARS